MNLAELKSRALLTASRLGFTFEGLLGEYGVIKTTLNRAVGGQTTLDLATAVRLFPLVQRVAQPGEEAVLELGGLTLCDAGEIAALRAEVAALRRQVATLSDRRFRELLLDARHRAPLSTHQPN